MTWFLKVTPWKFQTMIAGNTFALTMRMDVIGRSKHMDMTELSVPRREK